MNSEKGFTLIELLAVTVMVGVMAAIAAPSWSAFTNSQRLSAGQTTLFNAIRSAQSDAKKFSRDVTMTITPTTIATNRVQTELKDVSLSSSLGNNVEIVFNSKGQPYKLNNANFAPVQFQINANGTSAKRCTSIATLLGALQTTSEACGF